MTILQASMCSQSICFIVYKYEIMYIFPYSYVIIQKNKEQNGN